MDKTVAIIQARMGSTRLPGKSAAKIDGYSMVYHVIRRVKEAKVDDIVLAIPHELQFAALVDTAMKQGVQVYIHAGDPNDLVGRYKKAADLTKADVIVRVPGDNPCVDPEWIDHALCCYNEISDHSEPELLITNLDKDINASGIPGGLGAEVYSRGLIEFLDGAVHYPMLREHPHLWPVAQDWLATPPALITAPDLQFSVNTKEDLEFIQAIYHDLGPDFRSKELIEHVREMNGK